MKENGTGGTSGQTGEAREKSKDDAKSRGGVPEEEEILKRIQ